MIVNLTKNEIKHLVYLLGKGDADFPELNQNILNITNLSEDQKKELLNKTQIKISIIHPDNEKSILCRGKITDIELKNM